MSVTILIIMLLLFITASFFSIISLKTKSGTLMTAARYTFLAAAAFFTALGFFRFFKYYNSSFIEMISGIWGYFYLFTLLIILTILYLYLKGWREQLNSFIAVISPFITIIMLISLPFIDSSRKVLSDPGAGNVFSHILPVHIIISITGEIFFFFSFAGSVLYLIMEWQLRKKTSMKIIYQLPNLETINKFNKWSITRSFIFITFGIISGIIMAYIIFNTPSMGTPKEYHIYFSWIAISCVFWMRRNDRITSRKASIINIVLFIIVMFMFIFTNIFIIKGFHSFV
jgi:ABC-type transport system involved in cytochrome c biogenesis permease subunit